MAIDGRRLTEESNQSVDFAGHRRHLADYGLVATLGLSHVAAEGFHEHDLDRALLQLEGSPGSVANCLRDVTRH
jgi:hypothetical protein